MCMASEIPPFEITLKPDSNRPKLSSPVFKKLEQGIIEDSLAEASLEKGEETRVMLIVPYYTKIRRPLKAMLASIEKNQKNERNLDRAKGIIRKLEGLGIAHVEEWKRAGVPMGLLRIGTAAKKKGYRVEILDAVCEGWEQEREYFESSEGSVMVAYGLARQEIEKRIRECAPHVVGITCDYTHQWGNAREIADLAKTVNEKTVVVMGGTHAHGLPNDVLLDSPTDYVLYGQADATFVELLDFLAKKPGCKKAREIAGIVFKDAGEIVKTEKRKFMDNIDSIAIPDLSLVNLDFYSREFHSAGKRKRKGGKLIYGFASIGCNIGCTFCTIPGAQGKWTPSSEKTFDEYLAYITGLGVNEFLVEDDHLFQDPLFALKVFEKLKKYDLAWVEEGGVSLFSLIALLPEVGVDFILQGNTNALKMKLILEAKKSGLTTQELIRKMAESGCYNIYLAVESANDSSLSESNKPTLNTNEAFAKKVIGMLHENGIHTTCGLMLGFMNPLPGGITHAETVEQIDNTIEYGKRLKDANAAFINPFIFTPLPGAPHFAGLKQYCIKNTDEGFSHEFGTLQWCGDLTRDELSLLRVDCLIRANGIESYKETLRTGTWAVSQY